MGWALLSTSSRCWQAAAPVASDPMIADPTAMGDVLLFGLGLMLLDLKEVQVAIMLPALLFAPMVVATAKRRTL